MRHSDEDQRSEPQIVSVAALLFRGDRLLCMRRAAHRDAGAGVWETLSGRVRAGEEPLAAVWREIGEEAGLAVRLDERPLLAYSALRAGEPMTVILYRGVALDAAVNRSSEHDRHAWLTPDELAERTPLHKLVEAARLALATPWPAELQELRLAQVDTE